jgi:hypothetical protein
MVVFSAAMPKREAADERDDRHRQLHVQQSTHLLYDLGNGVLSFQPADCSSFHVTTYCEYILEF